MMLNNIGLDMKEKCIEEKISHKQVRVNMTYLTARIRWKSGLIEYIPTENVGNPVEVDGREFDIAANILSITCKKLLFGIKY